MDKETEDNLVEMLIKNNKELRDSGCKLAEAATRVIRTYDGVHRLSLAVAEWYKTLANENGRGS